MRLFPAIDLIGGKAVRLYKGRYDEMTVYGDRPWEIALDFRSKGADAVHIVDLEGARDGGTPNLETILRIKRESDLFCEVGGGVRGMDVVERYLSAGIDRVILGTAAIRDPAFLSSALAAFGDRIAVGADLNNGFVAVKGWLETTAVSADAFFADMVSQGVKTVICTDISRDGAMRGANLELYRTLNEKYGVDITASGGVSSLEDVRALAGMGLYGAIVGKAYYEGTVDLAEAVKEAAKC